ICFHGVGIETRVETEDHSPLRQRGLARASLHQQRRASALDLAGDLPMKAGGHAGDAARNDFPTLGNEALEKLGILIVDRLFGNARAAPWHRAVGAAERGAALGRFWLHGVLLDFPMQSTPAQERIIFFLFEAVRSARALLVAGGHVSRRRLSLCPGLRTLQSDDFLCHRDESFVVALFSSSSSAPSSSERPKREMTGWRTR